MLTLPLRRALFGLEVAASIVWIAVHARPLWQARWIQDDAYISFRYAKHWVQGEGLVYNLGARVEGYTNFLWTVLSAIPLAAGEPDPIAFMHVVGAILWLSTYALLLRLGIRLFAEGTWSAPLALLPLLAHYSYNQWFLSGMETPLVSFLVVAVVYCLSLDPTRQRFAPLLASLGAVLLALTRSDGVVPVVALAVAGVLVHARVVLRAHLWRHGVLLPMLPVLLIFIPFHVWRIGYYGSFFPNTYYAKAAYLTAYERGWLYLTTYLDIYPCVWLLPLLVVAMLVARGSARRFVTATTIVVLAVSFYVVRLGGDFMEWRFLTPIIGVLYPALVVAADVLACWLWSTVASRFDGPKLRPSSCSSAFGMLAGVVVAVALSLVTQQAEPRAREEAMPGQETIPLLGRYCDPGTFNWGEVGRLLDAVLPQGVTIATTSAGIIPFFCDRPCLDLHGLTDPEIARAPIDPANRGRMGHEHWLQDVDSIRRRGVQILLPWAAPKPHPLALVTAPTEDKELVSARLSNGWYIELEILSRSGLDQAALRADDRLVFYGDETAGRREVLHTLSQRFAGYEVVDTLDIQNDESHAEHGFEEIWYPGLPAVPNFHIKMLKYAAPQPMVTVYDDGRIIEHQATWMIDHVDAGRDLFMVVRNDRTGAGIYAVEINGKAVPGELRFASDTEAWDERYIIISSTLLVDGRNHIRLRRTSERSTEIYFAWFLQNRSTPAAAR